MALQQLCDVSLPSIIAQTFLFADILVESFYRLEGLRVGTLAGVGMRERGSHELHELDEGPAQSRAAFTCQPWVN